MGGDGRFAERKNEDRIHQPTGICLHAFSDLSHVSPVVFLYLLKECYSCGTCKATKRFHALQHQVHQVLYNTPQPGPAVFVAHCLFALPILEGYSEGMSHLIISALRRFLKVGTTLEDLAEAKSLAAQLFILIVRRRIVHEEGVLIKMIEIFEISLINIENAMCKAHLNHHSNAEPGQLARMFVERHIFRLIESGSYMAAVSLLEHFSIRWAGESFLIKMMQNKDYRAADKWATFMGKPMLCILIQEYSDRKLLKHAYEIIKKHNLKQEFPDIYHKCKESSLKKLAENGCWDVAEAKANGDKQLLEYLVYLAMEAGYPEKVDELCDRHSLKGFVNVKEPETSLLQRRCLNLNDLVVEDIIWVDEVNGLREATTLIQQCKVLGIDCEWKPNYIKGSQPNKVSIMQLATEKMVFIFDLIKLFEDVPDVLDNCLTNIFHSSSILKLGYNFQCDVKQLAHSYRELKCFKHYEMLLDIQNVFREPRGGLSALAEKILGVGLNKTRRNSNWEQRPLSRNQLEYAALDAAVLIHIFRHARSHSQQPGDNEGSAEMEWKSYIVSRMDNPKKNKKETRSKKSDARTDESKLVKI